MRTALARAGRKRKAGVKRDSTTGRSRGEIVDLTVVLNQPHRRGAKNPKSELLGYPLGRLRVEGLIDEVQLKTGDSWAALVRSYARMIGVNIGSPKSGSLSASVATGFYAWEGDAIEIDPEEVEKRRKALRDKYNLCHNELHKVGRTFGADLLKPARLVCIEERYPNDWQLGNLRIALNTLSRILRTN